ncbi:hypothetical protein ISCGN_028906 [Ixodes scapularis]
MIRGTTKANLHGHLDWHRYLQREGYRRHGEGTCTSADIVFSGVRITLRPEAVERRRRLTRRARDTPSLSKNQGNRPRPPPAARTT